MHRLHFADNSQANLSAFASQVASDLKRDGGSQALFHVYVDTKDREIARTSVQELRSALADAGAQADFSYVGSSTTANIADGQLLYGGEGPHAMIVCDVFEDATTRFEVLQMRLEYDCQEETTAALLKAVDERPWVKAVEMHACVGHSDVSSFCKALSAVRSDIVFFGGAALCPETLDVTTDLPYVFSSAGDVDDASVVFTLYGGENFHATTMAITGWKPLGPTFEVTRTERSTLYELDGIPAYDVYHRYLNIPNDEYFSSNGLLFPLAFDHKGMTMIKAPSVANPDHSLIMTSDVVEGQHSCRIAYGDPSTILESVRESTLALAKFAPEAISVYTCTARKIYWGDEYVSREHSPFQAVAPTTGWYTGSEFTRHGNDVLQYNVTLVVAGLREGPGRDLGALDVKVDDEEFSRQMALVRSLSSFVGTTSAELQDAYDRMEIMAKTDGLTGVADRREIESRIEDAIGAYDGAHSGEHGAPAADEKAPCTIMFDLDDFKVVNDAYGHKAGDDVLKELGVLLREVVDDDGCGIAGRWGGEEFMILLFESTLEQARVKAEEVRTRFADLFFPASGSHTLSLGVAQALPGESADLLCSRADKALYAAKKRGKNCTVVS